MSTPIRKHRSNTQIIKSIADRDRVLRLIQNMDVPFTITIVKGKHRSVWQNRLQRLWAGEISEQLGDQTPEEVRGMLKLQFGVPILRAENETFCRQYDAVIKSFPYETKIALMMEPLDLPITRLMTVRQKSQFLDNIYKFYTEKGLVLTLPPQDY